MKNKLRKLITLNIILGLLSGCGCNTKKYEIVNADYVSVIDNVEKLFSTKDIEQSIDVDNSTIYEVNDNEDITINKEGTYLINGTSKNTTIIVDTNKDEKVYLVLNNLNITNDNKPCIYVKQADKVFINITDTNNLTVTNLFNNVDDVKVDATIYSKDDITINGKGTLNIKSSDNGITSKDTIKITGGNINIDCNSDGLEANDSILIYNGNIDIKTKKDGMHAEYDEDNTKGYIYIKNCNISINAYDDGIHATTYIEIDNGKLEISAKEGLEATYIQINNGTINIEASDDGINAGKKSNISIPTIEINGGSININMGTGDTDGIDSNGNLYINGGLISINCNSPFDFDNESKYTGGRLIVNGVETNKISNQMMGGPRKR